MANNSAFIITVVALSWGAIGCTWDASMRAPTLNGTGTLQVVAVPGNRETFESVASADGKTVVFATTGPDAIIFSTNSDLRRLHKARQVFHLGWRDTDHSLVVDRGFSLDRIALPTLETLESVDLDPNTATAARLEYRAMMFLVGARGRGAYLSGEGFVASIETEPLRIVSVGRTGTRDVSTAVLDPGTGALVLSGDDGWVEVYDLEHMKTISRTKVEGV